MRYILLVFCQCCAWFVYVTEAQHIGHNVHASVAHTSMRNIELVDSFSKVKDSVTASIHLMRVDPYYFISCNATIATIDSDLAGYLLTKNAKDEYWANFAIEYNKQRKAPFLAFKAMCEEDQAVRRALVKCTDSFSRSMYMSKLEKTDSVHFDYLYAYVKKYGWPTYENGCMYAELIAIHDGVHMKEYLAFIRKAIESGYSSERFYGNIQNRAKPSTLKVLSGYRDKTAFDISYVLKGRQATVAQLKEMGMAAVECGGAVHLYFVYEARNEKEFKDFMNAGEDKLQQYWLAWDLIVHIEQTMKDKLLQTKRNTPYDFLFSETSKKQNRLMLYIVYR